MQDNILADKAELDAGLAMRRRSSLSSSLNSSLLNSSTLNRT